MSNGSTPTLPPEPPLISERNEYYTKSLPKINTISRRVYDFISENPVTQRAVIEKEVCKKFNYKKSQMNDAFKALKKKNLVISENGGKYRLTKNNEICGGKKMAYPQGLSSGDRNHLLTFKLLELHPQFHRLVGFISVGDWGSLPKNSHLDKDRFIDSEPFKKFKDAEVKIMRQEDYLQFWFKNERPGFDLLDISPLVHLLRELLDKWGVKGKIWTESIELRSQTDEIIEGIEGNPIYVKIIEGFAARIYKPKNEPLQKEIRVTAQKGYPWDVAETIGFIHQLADPLKHMEVMNAINIQTGNIGSRLDIIDRVVTDKYQNQLDFNLETTDEVNKMRDSFDSFNGTLYKMETEWKRDIKEITGLSFEFNEMKRLLQEENKNGGNRGPINSGVDPDVKILWEQNNNLMSKLIDKVNTIETDVKEVKEEVKAISLNQRKWRELDKTARLETIHEYYAMLKSWQKVADHLTTDKGTVWKWHDRNCNCKKKNGNGPQKMETPITPTSEISHEEYLRNEFSVSISEFESTQVLKVMKVLEESETDQVISILHHLPISNVRRCLSTWKSKGKLETIKIGKRKKLYKIRRKTN